MQTKTNITAQLGPNRDRMGAKAMAHSTSQQKSGDKQGKTSITDNRHGATIQKKIQDGLNGLHPVPSTNKHQQNRGNGNTKPLHAPNNGSAFYADAGLILQAKWVLGVLQLVNIGGREIPVNKHNQEILKDALDAILEAQNGTNGFLEWCEDLIDDTEKDGVWAHAKDIEEFYKSTKETWFSVNPILKEAWTRCINATRKIAQKSQYHKVGGKFKRKLEQLLLEIAYDFQELAELTDEVITSYINKEHIENKGLGGPQVQHNNLMDAGVGPKGLGTGKGSLSMFHIALHKLKSQGESLFNSMDPEILTIINHVKAGSTGDEMGVFTNEMEDNDSMMDETEDPDIVFMEDSDDMVDEVNFGQYG